VEDQQKETVNLNEAVSEIADNAKMLFGMNMVFSTGVISDKLIEKLRSGMNSADTLRLMSAIDMDHIQIAREIAMNV
jgi:IMP cyclohydrolase